MISFDISKLLPVGASAIITDEKGLLFVLINKDGKGYMKKVSSKEEGKKYIDEIFGDNNSKFVAKYNK